MCSLFKPRSTRRDEELRGSHSLNLLFAPELTIVDFIFVHGLGGGSRSTWSKTDDIKSYWLQAWLPHEPSFENVRIHAFGYNADWSKKNQHALDVHDFGKALLQAMAHSPDLRVRQDCPIVLIGHSMGGLVIKWAFMLAQKDPAFDDLKRRIHTLFFLGTPHRGAELARYLKNLLRITYRIESYPYVEDLARNSASLRHMNDTFFHHVENIQLYSFYETKEIDILVKRCLIVKKDSAIMGVRGEIVAPLLNTDHISMTKFDSKDDTNFKTICNALTTAIDPIRAKWKESQADHRRQEQNRFQKLLAFSEGSETDLMINDSLRTKGTCQWLVERSAFYKWERETINILWLNANPGTGKSVLAAFVVSYIRHVGRNYSYHCFQHSDNTLAHFLQSTAYHMASANQNIQKSILTVLHDVKLNQDYGVIWRKLFIDCIFKQKFDNTFYWIIDALDECKEHKEMTALLTEIPKDLPLKIFVTSRFSPERKHAEGRILEDSVPLEETMRDIQTYIKMNSDGISLRGLDSQQLMNVILEKSAGCFLWVHSIVKELRGVHDSDDIQQVLNTVPDGMRKIYRKIFNRIALTHYGKPLAKKILTWTICSTRPMTIQELEHALYLDHKPGLTNLRNSIDSLCVQLLYIDSESHVQMIHPTIKDFLLKDADSEFAIHEGDGNRRLAEVCITYLSSAEMKAPRGYNSSIHNVATPERSPFSGYACTSWYHHVAAISSDINSTSDVDSTLNKLGKFLGSSNVFTWIAIIAQTGELLPLIRAAKALKLYLDSRAVHAPPKGRHVQTIASWSSDLIRIVAQFGQNLLLCPSSIHQLIPAFCPLQSAPYRQVGDQRLSVSGLSVPRWNDCLSSITYGSDRTSAVACNGNLFAIGLVSGKIFVYHRTTCQIAKKLHISERVNCLVFSPSSILLACYGYRSVRVWHMVTGRETILEDSDSPLLALRIDEQDKTLIGVSKDNRLTTWDFASNKKTTAVDWQKSQSHDSARELTKAVISLELGMLATVSRGQPIKIWDLNSNSTYGHCGKGTGPQINESGRQFTHTAVVDLIFNPKLSINLLAIAYDDGDLVILDPIANIIKESVNANAEILATSSDGHTLASGNSHGTIKLFGFETLTLMCSIQLKNRPIKSLAFCSDNTQFVTIRGAEANVWEPSELVGIGETEKNSTTLTEVYGSGMSEIVNITATACHPTWNVLFCGKEDSPVSVYDAASGKFQSVLYEHSRDLYITSLAFDSHGSYLVSADSSCRLLSYKIGGNMQQVECDGPIIDTRLDGPISQILLRNNHAHMLVSSLTHDALFKMDGKSANQSPQTLQYKKSNSWRWGLHPTKSDQLFLLMKDTIRLYRWDGLTRVRSFKKSKILYDSPYGLTIKSINTYCKGRHCLLWSEHPYGSRSSTKTIILKSEDLIENVNQLSPNPLYNPLCDIIQHLIGESDSRLIFLNPSGWVCSADLDDFQEKHYIRHFFVPTDWLTANTKLFINLTSQGDLSFVHRGEIAIVKGGLDYIEPFFPSAFE